jgi:hypothetical protein
MRSDPTIRKSDGNSTLNHRSNFAPTRQREI